MPNDDGQYTKSLDIINPIYSIILHFEENFDIAFIGEQRYSLFRK